MDNLITVVSLQGKAWAVAQDGSRRELQVGDTVAADEMVVTAAGAQIDLQFADNQVLTLVGEQDAPVDVAQLAKEAELSQPLTPINSAKEDTSSAITVDDTLESEGHRFVQLVRIHEIIESDGFTPLTVARIQEIIKPLGMVLPERDFEQDRWKDNYSRNEHQSVDRTPPELQGGELEALKNLDADMINLDLSSRFKDAVSGSDITYVAENLPKGLTINPKTGVISGKIDSSASQGGNTGTKGDYKVTIIVTDPAGNSSEHDFVWTVTNPPPVATDDRQTIDEDTVATGNVIKGTNSSNSGGGADNDPDGDELVVTGFTVADDPTVYPAGTTVTITGVGKLTLNKNGDYTFTPNKDWSGSVPDVNYTITDGEGGTSNADLKITVNGIVTVDVPVVHPDTPTAGDTSDHVVFESGLTSGSKPDTDDLQVNSSFTLKALDGLDPTNAFSITYKDSSGVEQTFTLGKDAIEALGTTPETITTQYGELKLNGYSQAADGIITIKYDYLLKTAPTVSGDATNDDFVITVKDKDTDSATSTISIKIMDDAPVATNDANSVTEDTAAAITGNVMGGVGVSAGDVADTQGADGATVTGVQAGTIAADSHVADGGTATTITGQYGTLTLNADGSYDYQLDNSNLTVQGLGEGDTLDDEVFSYTITDSDGDQSTATITITVNGKNDGVTVTVPDPTDPADPNYPSNDPANPSLPTWGDFNDHVVFESGLVGGSQNSSDTDAVDKLVMVKSSFTLSALDGLAENGALTVGGKVFSKADVEGLTTDSPSNPIITSHGELVLNGYTLNADGTITIGYEYTLTSAPKNTAAGDSSDADKFTDDTIKITVNDRDSTPDTATEDLVIRIMDDVPSIEVDVDKVGSLVVDETDFDAIGTVSATNATFVAGVFTTTEGADGATTTYSLEVTDGTASGLIDTATGKPILLHQDGTDVVGRVENASGAEAFRIEIDADSGSVTLTQSRALQHPDPNDPDDPVSINNDAIKLHATAVDGDGDTVKSAGVDVGGKFTFRDDGPTIDDTKLDGEFVADNAIVDEQYLSSGSGYTDGSQLTVTKELPINYGADGAVAFDGTTGLTFNQSNLTALGNLNLKSGTTDLAYTLSADGHTITAKADSKGIFTIELKVAADGTPSYEFTLQGPLDHTLNADGETADNIVLPFEITATDGDDDSVDLKFKVEVVDDTPPNDARELDVNEDDSVSFSNADVNQTTTTVATAPDHGTVTIGNDGTITYVPNEDYRGSDSYTYTVTTDGGTYDRTVKITVKPVADKPLFADENGDYPAVDDINADGSLKSGDYNYSIITPEDVAASLQLTLPKIKDDAGTGLTDHSELLGAITLTPTGDGYVDDAKLQTGGLELKPAADGTITIVITDQINFHVSNIQTLHPEDTANGVYHLTKDQYEAITAHPAEDRHENFKVEVSVDSYEVDAGGKKLTDVDGANSKQTITVDVHAVTDPVGLQVKEGDVQTGVTVGITQDAEGKNKTADITFDEDTSFNLTNILEPAAFKDLDGSEPRSLTVEGLPVGTVINVGGTPYTIDSTGTATLEIAGDVAHDALPQITVTPPKDFSGDLTGIKVILGAKDSDSDSPAATPTTVTDEVTINLYVKPVGGDAKVEGVTGDEDTAIAFLKGIEVTDTGTGSEVITKVIFTVPDDWTVSLDGATWTNADGKVWKVDIPTTGVTVGVAGNTYTITGADLEAVLKDFTVTPPAHGSANIVLENVQVTTKDTNTVGEDTVVGEGTTESTTLEIDVKPVGEKIAGSYDADGNWVPGSEGGDTDGNSEPDLKMGGDHVYQTTGEEDEPFDLGNEVTTGFKLSTGWSNEDGKWVKTGEDWEPNTENGPSEDTFALLTPYETIGNNAQANAAIGDALEGSVFIYNDGTKDIAIPFAGKPVQIPMQYLDSVQFKGPADWSGVVKIKVQAGTIDYDEDDNTATDLTVSGESWLTNLIIEPRADQVTLKVDTPIKTLEDRPVKLNIVPTSSDKNETFDVTISGIPKGATVKYWENGVEKTFTATTDSSSLSITNFDKMKQPELTPPQDSNEPISLTVKAESVDTLTYIDKDGTQVTVVHKGNTKTYYDKDGVQVGEPVVDDTAPDTSSQLPINVEVQGVPDTPNVTIKNDMEYWEDGAEESSAQGAATGLIVDLKDLVTEMESGEIGVEGTEANPQPDDSETITLRISDLPEGFTLTGAGPQLGGSGESRVWVISESQLNDVKIIVPANYSGTVDFTVQPVVTENDNPSEVFFDKQNVSFKVNPVPEASLSVSSELIEDTVGKLDLRAVHQNGDTDEFISAVKIKAIDGVTFYSDVEGTTELTPVGGYYEISGDAVNSIYVKGPANFSGNQGLVVEYKVTDPSADLSKDPVPADAVPAVESDWISGSHNLIVGAITDSIGAALNPITAVVDNPEGSFNFNDTTDTATINGTGKVTVTVDISQQADANADGETDTDGSEQLTHIVIDGVPQGVSVEGAVQTGPGQWLLEVNSSFNTETLIQDVVFNVTGVAGTSENNAITITSYSKDTGASSQQQADISFNLNINQGPGPDTELPTVTLSDKNPAQTEDVKFSLAEQVGGSISGGNVSEYQITVTLRTNPDDETVYTDADGNQLIRTEVRENGEPVILWTKSVNVTSVDNADAKLAELLGDIKVQAPKHANNNNLPGGLPLDVTVSVHANGLSKQDQLKPSVNLTPVTDDTTVTITAEPVGEGEDIIINIELENLADGEFSNIEGNKITVTLDGSELAGKLLGADGEPLTPTTEGGNTYEVELVDGKPPQLTFRPDSNQPHQTGSLGITASVTATEQGATNTVTTTGSGSLVIEASNSGYQADITAQGDELNNSNSDFVKLELTNASLIDSGEQIDSAFISGLPSGFTVWVGEPAAMANNAGGGTWAIPLDGNNLPANISIKPPKNWSGTLEGLKLTVMSGHAGLTPTASEIGFELVVNPTPDGVEMNPTLSFGDAGDKIALNLNASMKDPSKATGAEGDQYTELTELRLTGFPDGQKVQFFIGDSEVPLDGSQATFDGSTWTITGLSQSDLQNLKFLHGEGSADITVKGRTYEVNAAGEQYKESGDPQYSDWSGAKTAAINISPTVPTSEADTFLWEEGKAINGFAGEDTVQLRFGDNLSTTDFSKMENIEIIDMSGKASGNNSITGLTPEDVFNMTDDDNLLKIIADKSDTVDLGSSWGAGATKDGKTTYSYTDPDSSIKINLEVTLID